ncbi:MAG: hypothetical protein WCW13_05000 [archaeon]|jgi:hypothetical protein
MSKIELNLQDYWIFSLMIVGVLVVLSLSAFFSDFFNLAWYLISVVFSFQAPIWFILETVLSLFIFCFSIVVLAFLFNKKKFAYKLTIVYAIFMIVYSIYYFISSTMPIILSSGEFDAYYFLSGTSVAIANLALSLVLKVALIVFVLKSKTVFNKK